MNAEQLEQQRIGSMSNLNGLIPNLSIDNFRIKVLRGP